MTGGYETVLFLTRLSFDGTFHGVPNVLPVGLGDLGEGFTLHVLDDVDIGRIWPLLGAAVIQLVRVINLGLGRHGMGIATCVKKNNQGVLEAEFCRKKN